MKEDIPSNREDADKKDTLDEDRFLEEEEQKKERIKTGKDFVRESAMMHLQNTVLLDQLENVEAEVKELEGRVKLLENTAKEKDTEVKQKKNE